MDVRLSAWSRFQVGGGVGDREAEEQGDGEFHAVVVMELQARAADR